MITLHVSYRLGYYLTQLKLESLCRNPNAEAIKCQEKICLNFSQLGPNVK